jgi:hypothetical protein
MHSTRSRSARHPHPFLHLLIVALVASVVPGCDQGPPEPQVLPLEVEEVVGYGVEAEQARILVDVFNPVLDSARHLPGFDDFARTTGLPGERDAVVLGHPTYIAGIARLPGDDLDAWAHLQYRIVRQLEDHSTGACGRFARGELDLELALRIVNGLEAAHLRELASLEGRGLLAELEAEGPLPDLERPEFEEAMDHLIERMPPAQRSPFTDVLAVADRDDRQACDLFRLGWSFLPQLDETRHKRALVRWF